MLSQSSVTIPESSLDGVPEVSVISPQAISTTPTPPQWSAQRPNAIRRFSEHLTHSISAFRERVTGRNAARRMTLQPEEMAKEDTSRARKCRTVREARRTRDQDSKASSDYQPITDLLAIMSATTAFPAPRSGARLREMLPHALWVPNHLRDLHQQNHLRDLHQQNQLRDLQLQASSHLQKMPEGSKEHRTSSCNCFKVIHPYSYFRSIAGFG